MSATLTNGKARPQLSDEIARMTGQLDRMDVVLDGLSDALNEACKDAAREGTRQAVKEAVIELLCDPDLRTALHQASAQPTPAAPLSPWQRLKAAAHRAVERVKDAMGAAAVIVGSHISKMVRTAGRMINRMRESVPVRVATRILAAAIGVVALARAGAARRVVALADRARLFLTERVATAWGWLRAARLQLAGG
jgi:hypothetical protein